MSAVAPGATCRVSKGFFVLRPCAQPAVAACPRCARALCQEHVVVTPVGNVCPECASEVTEVPDARVDPQWGLRFRRRYYQAADDDLGGGVVETLFDVFDLFSLGGSTADGFDDDSDVDFFDS